MKQPSDRKMRRFWKWYLVMCVLLLIAGVILYLGVVPNHSVQLHQLFLPVFLMLVGIWNLYRTPKE